MNLSPFDQFAEEYDRWYEENLEVFNIEINALKVHIPTGSYLKSLEVGVGTGRFAERLKITYGVDPSWEMIRIAKKRGIKVIRGVAENLPFISKSFDLVFLITTLCFLKDPEKSLQEIKRILKPKGLFVLGIIDRESPLGKLYEQKKNKSKYYKYANFFSAEEVINLLEKFDFKILKITQSLFESHKTENQIKEGYGEGGFVVISAEIF